MLGPYRAENDGSISYKGNKIFAEKADVNRISVPIDKFQKRIDDFQQERYWSKLHRINHRINLSVNEYFNQLEALFTLLPLTTRMISSPGAAFGKNSIDYTDDTSPVKLEWFDLDRDVFLSESSQIYLELALAKKEVESVYSVYNSFRKEQADATHLAEFHHVEYEGQVGKERNIEIAQGLIKKIVRDLIRECKAELLYFLTENEIQTLNKKIVEKEFKRITFNEALQDLYEDTGDDKYQNVTLENFGSWEEVRITEMYEDLLIIEEFPLLEIAFYHAEESNAKGKNADFIWPGYREILGSGERIQEIEEIEDKAETFNLAKEDYAQYLHLREMEDYTKSSGFGLGWERFLQGLLKMPTIWSVTPYPRTHKELNP